MFAFALATYIIGLVSVLTYFYTKWFFKLAFEETMEVVNGMLVQINDDIDEEFGDDPTL